MSIERESLEKQRADLLESLRLIDERIAQYVSPTDVPLQLLRDQKSLRQRLDDIKQRLQATPAASAHIPPATTTTQTITNLVENQGAQGTFNAPVTFNIGTPVPAPAPEPPAPAPEPPAPEPPAPVVQPPPVSPIDRIKAIREKAEQERLRREAEAEQERLRREAERERLRQKFKTILYESGEYFNHGGRSGLYAHVAGAELDQIEADLRAGLVAILDDPEQLLPTPQRVRAGFLLGQLGDPRYPVTLAQWQAELARRNEVFGQPAGYFCYVRGGTYTIGTDADAAPHNQKPAHRVTVQPFWIARYPITNQQWQVWVQQGGEPSYYAGDTDLNAPNQPIIGVTWYMCRAFCAWLTQQLAAYIPANYYIRLPTEAEWEIAAAYDAAQHRRVYPWGDAWADEHAATAENRASKGTQWTAPVGCFARGAAAAGPRDMAGNVWEWSASPYTDNYAKPASHTAPDDGNQFTLRGGSFYDNSTYMPCGARDGNHPDIWVNFNGVRVVCAPRLR